MSSKRCARLLLAVAVAGVLPACGNINDGHPPVPFTILASVNTAGALGNQVSDEAVISGDGRFVVFSSASTTFVPLNTNGVRNVFRRNMETGAIDLVTLGIGGVAADLDSARPSISHDGRWVAFESSATNLTPLAPGGLQVYRRDMNETAGTGIEMVSRVSPVLAGNGFSQHPSISADGQFVAFSSNATNFGDAHANGVPNIYRRDMTGATIILISVNTSGGDPTPPPGNPAGSTFPSISSDGSRIAYVSDCTDLVAFDINDFEDVFVATVDTPIVTAIASPGLLGGGIGISSHPSISGDGRFVAYQSSAFDLVAIDTNFTGFDVFVFDVDGSTVGLVSVNAAGFQGSVVEESTTPSLSFDGRYVAFRSTESNLVEPDLNQAADVFVKDLQTGAVTCVSVSTSGIQGAPTQNSVAPSLSRDGRSVAFLSEASLVKGDVNGLLDAYVRAPLR
jgi:Tol biopolymer transport system component